MSRFRIVIADDDSQETTLVRPLRDACPEADIWQVKCLRPDADAYPKSPWLCERDWRPDYLFRCDVLVLDMNIDCVHEYLPAGTGGQWRFGGEGFIERFHAEWPGQAILMWTLHDAEPMPCADALTRKQLQEGWRGPHIAKYCKSNESTLRMRESIRAMYEDFQSCGSLTDWDQIEFAASHDLPVLVVGESGTGKERVAWSIHRRWRTEKLKANADLHIPGEPAVVNCAGLSEQLARSELFGCVKGSFTGADDHRVGKCLLACGVDVASLQATRRGQGKESDASLALLRDYTDRLAELDGLSGKETVKRHAAALEYLMGSKTVSDPRPSVFGAMERVLRGVLSRAGKAAVDEYAELLRQSVPGLIDTERSDGLDIVLKTVGNQPFGTLFLDEFGDLPSSVQALLLRYLQSFEVQPLGYPGFVRNARVRIIAATSDPGVAEMVGKSLGGRVREGRKDDLREDLIFRVKGQIIRVSPVDESNLRAEFEREISKHGIPWDTSKAGAVVYIVEELRKVIVANREATASGRTPPFAFGHRREISRIVRLANAFVTGAADRGVKGIPCKVTREIVANLWQPSMVTGTGIPPIMLQQPEPESVDQFTCRLTKTIIDLVTAKAAVHDLHARVHGHAGKTTTAALGRGASAEAFLLTWFSAYYDEGGKDFWNHRAAVLAFAYTGRSKQADASVKRVARTLFEVTGRDAITGIVKEAARWKDWFVKQPDASWPFSHVDLPPAE